MVRVLFQFTPLREGRRQLHDCCQSPREFQFTPLREGRRACWLAANSADISIHAPPRGATSTRYWRISSRTNFNSRPSARGDAKRCYMANMAWIFQFTPLREGRPQMRCASCKRTSFQFTPLREGRRHEYQLWSLVQYFNSRPSARGDRIITRSRRRCQFQFTPLREGRRSAFRQKQQPERHFNSRPSARGD